MMVLGLLCKILGDTSLLNSLHELAFTLPLDILAFLADHCTDLHGRHTACSLSGSGDVVHLLSRFRERV